MTTDITELAAVLRLAAESEIACRAEGDTSDLWQDEASPANVIALVEALEKAQQHIARQEQILLNQDESLSIRRGELEAAHQRIAGLESRPVTVKLPDLRQVVSGDRYVWSDGVFNYSQDVKAELTAKGIKWEAE